MEIFLQLFSYTKHKTAHLLSLFYQTEMSSIALLTLTTHFIKTRNKQNITHLNCPVFSLHDHIWFAWINFSIKRTIYENIPSPLSTPRLLCPFVIITLDLCSRCKSPLYLYTMSSDWPLLVSEPVCVSSLDSRAQLYWTPSLYDPSVIQSWLRLKISVSIGPLAAPLNELTTAKATTKDNYKAQD